MAENLQQIFFIVPKALGLQVSLRTRVLGGALGSLALF